MGRIGKVFRAIAIGVMISLAATCTLFAFEPVPWNRPIQGNAIAPVLEGGTGWINGKAPTQESLRGKVVLVEFWTYSCINCLRTLPYVRAWEHKYRDHGLVVLGVHTPEFGFERQAANVQRAAQRLGIDYPVVLDSQRAIWHAFGNRAWPALYLVDAAGRLRLQRYGEGEYDQIERQIQRLLMEAGFKGVPDGLVAPQGEGTQAQASGIPAQSAETYIGKAQSTGFARKAPAALRKNEWTATGAWDFGTEFATLTRPGGRIAYRFQARDLHMVLGPVAQRPVRFRVTIDGRAPGLDHGADTNAQGYGMLDALRLYQLVRQQSPQAERVFEIEFLDPEVRAFAFTFG